MNNPLAVLIVEDSDSDAQLIVRLLTKAGYEVASQQVESAEQMRAALKARAWDIVLSDYSLPQFDGRAALELVKEEQPDIPFIVVSGTMGEESAVAMMRSGAHDYLIKGDLARLAPAVKRELERAQDRRERKQVAKQLQENQSNLTALIENTEDRIWAVDSEYRLIVSNAQFTNGIIGDLKQKISIGQSIFPENLPPKALDEWRGYYDRALGGESFSIELATQFSLIPKYRDYNFHPIRSADGSVTGVVVSGRDITERKMIEDTLLFLLEGGYSDENFFHSLARYLAKKLDMDYVCIDRLAGDQLSAQTVAIYFDGKFEDDVSYTLKDTPCGDVVGNSICVFPDRVRHLFPKDVVLQDMVAESYVGTTLWSTQGQPIGLIAVIGRKPLKNHSTAEAVLKLVSVRAAGELERKQAEEALRESEDRYRTLVEFSPDSIGIHYEGKIVYVNTSTVKLFHANSPQDLIGLPIAQFVHPDYQAIAMERVRRSYENHMPASLMEEKFITLDGQPIDVEVTTTPIVHDGKSATQIIIRDITERKVVEDQLRQLSRAVEQSPASIIITDVHGKIEYVNPKFAVTTGYTLDEVRGKNPRFLKSDKTPPELYPVLWQTILPGKEWREELFNRKKNGEPYWENSSISAITDSKGKITHFVAVNEDITARKKADEEIRLLNIELEQQALTDYLTNLYNRRYFMQRGAEEVKRANRSHQTLALLMLDIDEFKKVNDSYGHEAGDLALQQVAVALKADLRETDVIARMGGEEFAVLLPNTSLDEAFLLAERVRLATANTPIEIVGEALDINITVCIGAAVITQGMSSIDNLLRNADAALYHAKNNGRNRVIKYKEISSGVPDLSSGSDDE